MFTICCATPKWPKTITAGYVNGFKNNWQEIKGRKTSGRLSIHYLKSLILIRLTKINLSLKEITFWRNKVQTYTEWKILIREDSKLPHVPGRTSQQPLYHQMMMNTWRIVCMCRLLHTVSCFAWSVAGIAYSSIYRMMNMQCETIWEMKRKWWNKNKLPFRQGTFLPWRFERNFYLNCHLLFLSNVSPFG